jgi:SagB-type dehydrogenase family enzyme
MKVKPYDDLIRERRDLLKSHGIDREEWESHQRRGVPPPPLEKPYSNDAILVDLKDHEETGLGTISLVKAIGNRKSNRRFTSEDLKLEELSFLLWATQGVRSVDEDRVWTKRTVPSGGARHPFETYLMVNRVEGIEPGVYRYLPIEHKLVLVNGAIPVSAEISEAAYNQAFVGEAAVVFVWAAMPYRTEWRYSVIGYKDIAVEAGHICQNLYLACEAIGAGTCAILAYDQNAMDTLIGVDGEDEFTVYLAPVGKIHGSAT